MPTRSPSPALLTSGAITWNICEPRKFCEAIVAGWRRGLAALAPPCTMACTTDVVLPECAGRSRGKWAKPPWPAGGGWAPLYAIVNLTQELRSLSRKVKEAAGVTLCEATVAGWRRLLGQHGANHVSVGYKSGYDQGTEGAAGVHAGQGPRGRLAAAAFACWAPGFSWIYNQLTDVTTAVQEGEGAAGVYAGRGHRGRLAAAAGAAGCRAGRPRTCRRDRRAGGDGGLHCGAAVPASRAGNAGGSIPPRG